MVKKVISIVKLKFYNCVHILPKPKPEISIKSKQYHGVRI